MRKDDNIRLRHMRDAASEAIGFAAHRTRADLDLDRMLVLSLVKAIEIIGEAANQVSEATASQMPELPWSDIVGMRNRLVHAYFDINLDILWATVQTDLPALLKVLDLSTRDLS